MPSMVNDVSAMFVLTTTLRPGTPPGVRGGGASRAGDFVWTHGEAGWRDRDASPVKAHYMHVWQKRADGWRLIFETLINDT